MVGALILPKNYFDKEYMPFLNWSKNVWTVIHCMTLEYEINLQQNTHMNHENYEGMITILENLPQLMDCYKCKNKFVQYLKDHPPRSDNSIFDWTVKVHNYVSSFLSKPPWTIEAAREHYRQMLYVPGFSG
jgi:hypothetical protein